MSIKDFFEKMVESESFFVFFVMLFAIIVFIFAVPFITKTIVNSKNAKEPIEIHHARVLKIQNSGWFGKMVNICGVIVELENGERKMFDVDLNCSMLLIEGEEISMSSQGSRMLKFEKIITKTKVESDDE